MNVYFSGLALGLSLITSLGPQNIFLIRQGTLRKHAMLSAVVCFICDVILVTASVAGLHHALQQYPLLRMLMSWAGGFFLFYYAVLNLKRGLESEKQDSSHAEPQPVGRGKIIILALGFSLLNPHAIIDTLILIGGTSGQFPGQQQAFLLGVISSSFLWFTSLTLLTRLCGKWLGKASVWRFVELSSGLLMLLLSVKLIGSQMV